MCLALCACAQPFPGATLGKNLHHSSTTQVLAPFRVHNVTGIGDRKLDSASGVAHSKVRAGNPLLLMLLCKCTTSLRAIEALINVRAGRGPAWRGLVCRLLGRSPPWGGRSSQRESYGHLLRAPEVRLWLRRKIWMHGAKIARV